MNSGIFPLLSATIVVLDIYLLPGDCQMYTWTHQPSVINNQPCTHQLNLTWTYTPASPGPALIEWTKRNAGGTLEPVATFTGGNFNPAAGYKGRLVRLGNTAEIQLMNSTSADDGIFRVSVLDSGGDTITSETAVSTVITSNISGITATCEVDGKTVMCAGVTSLGIPGANLTLSYDVDGVSMSKNNRGTHTTVSHNLTSRGTVRCSISGPATECLASGVTKSSTVDCGQTTSMLTTTTVSTATTTAEKDDNKTLIILVCVGVVVLAIGIIIIIICCVRRKNAHREKKHEKELEYVAARPDRQEVLNTTSLKTDENDLVKGKVSFQELRNKI